MQIAFTQETLLHGLELALLLAGGWVSLKIQQAVAGMRKEQSVVKEELVASQTALQTDMNAKHAENKQAIAVHVASDDRQFDSIGESLKRIEAKVDHRNVKGD